MSNSENSPALQNRVLWLAGIVLAGAACTRWMPSNWFLTFLSYSILVALILAIVVVVDLKNEKRPPIPIAVLLEIFWLPSRNGDVKLGLVFWAFLGVVGFVAGMLGAMLVLPFIT